MHLQVAVVVARGHLTRTTMAVFSVPIATLQAVRLAQLQRLPQRVRTQAIMLDFLV